MKLEDNPADKDLNVIKEVLDNIVYNDVRKNKLADLEQRYGKSANTLLTLKFNSDFRNELEILKEIQKIK